MKNICLLSTLLAKIFFYFIYIDNKSNLYLIRVQQTKFNE